jgi:molybdate transport repressor ModE-like protein
MAHGINGNAGSGVFGGEYMSLNDDVLQEASPGPKITLRPRIKVLLVSEHDNEVFCGPGMGRLVAAILETGTVRRACEKMEMSYSKGWKLLKKLETWLGYPVAVRHQGGKGGGEAFLTPEGLDFLKRHTAFESECQCAIEDVFRRYYGGN